MPPAYPQVTFEEMRVEAAVKAAVEGTGAQLRAHWGGATLQPPQDLPFPLTPGVLEALSPALVAVLSRLAGALGGGGGNASAERVQAALAGLAPALKETPVAYGMFVAHLLPLVSVFFLAWASPEAHARGRTKGGKRWAVFFFF